MKETNVIVEKSVAFAIKIVWAYQLLCSRKEFVLSKQLLRSGTSIGANIHEAVRAPSRADFFAKMAISLKEGNETSYWLTILHRTNYFSAEEYNSLNNDCTEINKILMAISRANQQNNAK